MYNIELEINKIIKKKKKINEIIKLTKNTLELEYFLNSEGNSVKLIKEINKGNNKNYKDRIKYYYLDKYFKKELIEYKNLLLKFPVNFEVLRNMILSQGNELLTFKIKPKLIKNLNNDFGLIIENYHLHEKINYDKILNEFELIPNNLIGIINSTIGYNGKNTFYYGNPIFYEENKPKNLNKIINNYKNKL